MCAVDTTRLDGSAELTETGIDFPTRTSSSLLYCCCALLLSTQLVLCLLLLLFAVVRCRDIPALTAALNSLKQASISQPELPPVAAVVCCCALS